MILAISRCAALFYLAANVSAESSISELLSNEAAKHKRSDISVTTEDANSGQFAAFTHALEQAPITDSKKHENKTKDSDDKGDKANSMLSILNAGAAKKDSHHGGLVDDKVADWRGHKVDLSKSSRQIVSGMIEAFMHRAELLPGEKECLEHSVGTCVSNLVVAVRDAVEAIKDLVNASNQVGLIPELMDAGMRVSTMVAASTQMARNCVQGDALSLLNETGHNLVNMKYIGQRWIVSGIDIAQALADSIVSFEEHKFHKFGQDIGLALRKVLLSTATTGLAKLPEGVPHREIIEEGLEGLASGFFSRGMHLVVMDKADPKVRIDIDLHTCVAGNDKLFKEVWNGLWTLIAQFAANKEQHGLDFKDFKSFINGSAGQPTWSSELMDAMLQVPMALSRCGLDLEMGQMLTHAIKSLGQLNVSLKMPHEKVKADEATRSVALAVEYWTNFRFKEFGTEIGHLLRDILLLIFPKLYSIDSSGRLQRNLLTQTTFDSKAITGSTATGFYAIVGVAFVMMMSLVALKTLRTVSCEQRRVTRRTDLETAWEQDVDGFAE